MRQGPYTRSKRPAIGPRTLNQAEIAVCERLEREGYTVVKRGWPDFLAWNGRELRFIEVKTSPNSRGLKASQQMVADALRKYLGVEVELICPDGISVPHGHAPPEDGRPGD